MSEKYYVGGDITSFSDNGKYKPISRVTLLVDDENSLTAGDDTGMEVIASCPHATQPMVNALLQTMKGYRYQAYEAGAANIDPAAELGDGVTVGGIYSPLSKLSDDGRGYAGISSPGEAEMEDEYPADGYITQEFNRKISETRSLITKTSEAIMLKVEGVDGRVTSLSTSINGIEANISSLNGSITNITADIDGLRTTVSGKIDGSTAQSMIDQSIDEIMLKVEGIDGKYTEVKTTLDGLTVTDQSGTTKIKGSSIETESIAANSISADKLNLTGSITFGDLDANAQNSINTANSNASTAIAAAGNAQAAANGAVQKVSAWEYPGSTYIDGSKIMTGTVMATNLLGGTVGLLASDESIVGALNLAYTTTGIGLGILTSHGGIQIQSAGNLFMSAGTGGAITIQNGLVQLGSAALCLATASFGTSAPSGSGVAGQLYIQLVS